MTKEQERNIKTNQDKLNEWAKLHGISEDDLAVYTVLIANFTDALEEMDARSEEAIAERDTLRSLCSFFFDVEPTAPFAMFFSFFAEGYGRGMKDWNEILTNTTKEADKE